MEKGNPIPLTGEHATEEIRKLVFSLHDVPGTTRDRLKDKLYNGASSELSPH